MHVTFISMYKSDLKEKKLESTKSNQHYMEIKTKAQHGILQQTIDKFELKEDKILMYIRNIYVPNSRELKNLILK
jgi:hypothetical protein